MVTCVNYNPVPPRVWYRVQNACSTNQILNINTNDIVFIPLLNKFIKYRNVQSEMQMIEKGNILQYKINSANLTKTQKYSQIAKGFGSTRRKCYSSQTQTVTNPNTSSFARVNFTSIPYPNIIVGKPNNIAGPFQVNTPDPFGCKNDILKDGGNLVCNAVVNPCTNDLQQLFRQENLCYPNTCSDVPGKPTELCWNSSIKTWFPRKKYIMNNSLNKWPVNYKGFVSAVTPIQST